VSGTETRELPNNKVGLNQECGGWKNCDKEFRRVNPSENRKTDGWF